MATNKSARDTMVVVAVVVAFAIVIMGNLLADRKFTRVDLTAEQKYSISEPFKNIMGRLDDTLTITYYVSGQVPTWFEITKRDMLDKLHEIESASKGKVQLQVVDPSKNKELRERLAQSEIDVQDVGSDEVKWSKLITALELTYKDKPKSLIPAIGAPEQIEYALGSRILELTVDKKPQVAVMAPPAPPQAPMMGMNQRQQTNGYEWLQTGQWQGEDAKKFDIKSVDLTENNTIPPDTKLLILIRPNELSDRQRYEVTKYLAGGGKVFLIASPYKIEHQFGWRVDKQVTGLEGYLKDIGIGMNQDFLADESCMRMPTEVNMFTGEVKYARLPMFIRIAGENIDQESVLTRLMAGLLMPFAAEIQLDSNVAEKKGLTPRVLARTTEKAWTIPYSDTFQPDKYQFDSGKKENFGSKNVFVMLTGQFPFPFEGKPVPPWNKGDDKSPAPALTEKKEELGSVEKKPGTLVICSSPEAFHMTYLNDRNVGSQMQNNAALVVNMAETFSLGDDLVKLRAKRYESRTIDKMIGEENDRKRSLIKFGLIAGIPILVVLLALLRFILRRSAQVSYERQYSQTIGPSSFTS
jgi:ABC-type uncharacterized transport system involved in gliding motility auxiliary subunit